MSKMYLAASGFIKCFGRRDLMHLNILIADPNTESARRMAGWIEGYGSQFKCRIVDSGLGAADYLRTQNIALLVTELQLPDLDGFGLLDHINTYCPEIPVVVVSSHGRPKTREILMRKGASIFLEKPLDTKIFLAAFEKALSCIRDGGALNGTSLDTFAQMIEMEQKTCTLRVTHPPSQGFGLLFFRSGEIVQARIPGGPEGVEAAYEILAWQPVSLMIENRCKVQVQKIHADLQALLMEAMRLKDERLENEPLSPASETVEKQTDNPVLPMPSSSEETPDPVHRWLKSIGSESLGIESVYQDASWRDLLSHADVIGSIFESGKLVACYLNVGDGSESIILPDGQDTVLAVSSGCKREQIVGVVSRTPPVF